MDVDVDVDDREETENKVHWFTTKRYQQQKKEKRLQ
jgi:hypothetical protein